MYERRMKASAISALPTYGQAKERHAAIDAFCRKYFHELVGMLQKRVGDPEAARDLAQTAFERFAARVDAPHLLEEPRGYLMEIARNAHIDHVRKEDSLRTIHRNTQVARAGGEVEHLTPEETVAQRQRLAELERLIRALPPMRRRIFILNRIHQLSPDEIAEQEGMVKRAVRSHIQRALADIRAAMSMTGGRRSWW